MKKTTTLLMFLIIMTISLTQSCNDKTDTKVIREITEDTSTIYEAKDTVAIYLTSVIRQDVNGKSSYHLAMFDANGDYAIDNLITKIKIDTIKKPGSGNIQWITVIRSGIKKIIEIKPVKDTTVILFRNGTYEKHGIWYLDLPDTINIPEGQPYIKEEYFIKYIPRGSNDTITIDPYLRVPPD